MECCCIEADGSVGASTATLMVPDSARTAGGWFGRSGTLCGILFRYCVPATMFLLIPKCPVCLAGHVLFWTGISVSLKTATVGRWSLMVFCSVVILTALARRIFRRTPPIPHQVG